MKRGIFFILLCLFAFTNCKQIPNERIPQYMPEVKTSVSGDSLIIFLGNPIAAPLQFLASSQYDVIQDFLIDAFPVVVNGFADTTLVFVSDGFPESPRIRFNSLLGDPSLTFTPPVLELPFPNGKTYEVIQGYYGTFSHNSDFSRYALDFNMAVGDTITAAAYGYVVGVVDGYKHGGNNRKWMDFANFITLYHPEFNVFTQYVHLVHNGSLVALGDTVVAGQPVALSGNTGFSSGPHLHFNVLRPMHKKVVSTPVASIGNYKGEELVRGFVVRN